MSDLLSPSMPQEMAPLLGNEEFLWAGKPKEGLMFRKSDWLAIPVSLVLLGTALKPYWDARGRTMHPVEMAGLAIFVVLGVYLLIGRFFIDAYIRRDMVYGLTSHRALIIGGLFGRKVLSIDLRTLQQMALTQRRDGLGTITFGPTGGLNTLLAGGFWIGGVWIHLMNWRQKPQDDRPGHFGRDEDPPPPEPARFEAIPDAAMVMAKIQQAQAALAAPPAVPNASSQGITPAWQSPR